MFKNQILVPLGEYLVSDDPQKELVTVVGSCVAVILYDRENQIGGLAHIVLPGRRLSIRKNDKSAYYADTGVFLLIEEMIKKKAQKENISAYLAGGASLNSKVDNNETIGRKNIASVVSILRKKDTYIKKKDKDIGGFSGRRVVLDIGTGDVKVRQTAHYKIL